MEPSKLPYPPPESRTKLGILSVDPGPGCGLAIYHPYPAVDGFNFHTFTVELGKEGHIWLRNVLAEEYDNLKRVRMYKGNAVCVEDVWLICEKFEFRKDDQRRDRIDYTAGEYVGVAKLVADDLYDGLVMQGSAEGKGFWSDAKLDQLNQLRKPLVAGRHENDALRHLLRFMTFKLNQTWLLGYLRNEPKPQSAAGIKYK